MVAIVPCKIAFEKLMKAKSEGNNMSLRAVGNILKERVTGIERIDPLAIRMYDKATQNGH